MLEKNNIRKDKLKVIYMKKILVSFATLAVISSSIMTTTAWAKNKQHIQTKDPDHQLCEDTSYSNLDFGNFQSVMHPFSFQKMNPTIADVNVNVFSSQDIYNSIANYLDQRLASYYVNLDIFSTSLLKDNINANTLGTNFDIIDRTTGLEWVPPNLTSGQYECYNLELVNLLSHTNFTFSLNYCDFNLNDIINPINSTPNVDNQVYSISDASSNGGISDFFPWNSSQPYTTFDLSNYLKNVNQNVIWPSDKYFNYLLKIDNYFLNPITWKWNSSLKITDFFGYYYAQLLDNSDQGGYNSQINYQIDQNSTDHYGLVKPVSPPLKGGGVWPRKWQANTLARNNIHGGAASGNNGRLDEYGDLGWASTAEMYNVWNMNGDTEHYQSSDWGQDAQDMLYIDQFWSGDGSNQINLAPYIAGFSNVSDWPGEGFLVWYLDWTFTTTEMDTSYKDVFTQASAYQVTGLEDYSTFMTYNDPNKILKNEDEIYYLYNSSQSITFNSTYLTSATVSNKQVPLDKPYTLDGSNTGVNYTIRVYFKDPSVANSYYGNQGDGSVEMHIVIHNKYDFSKGIDDITWDPTTSMLDIYLDQDIVNIINSRVYKGHANPYNLLAWLDKNNYWSNIINNKGIDYSFGSLPGISSIDWRDNIDQNITDYNDSNYSAYQVALQDKVITPKGHPEIHALNPQHGVVFKLHLDGAYVPDNFGDHTLSAESPYTTKYWDPVLFNQLSYSKESYSPIGPSSETAQAIADKLQGNVIVLDPKFWVGKDIKNYKEQLDNAIVAQGILTKDEVQYVSWGDLTLNQAKSYPNCDFTVSKDGETAVAHYITLDVQDNAKKTFNQINNLIEKNIIKEGSGEVQYLGPDFENPSPSGSYIDTNNPKEMNDLKISLVKDYPSLKTLSWYFWPFEHYIYFDEMRINNGEKVTMHLKVGNYTKDYQVYIWWRSMS